MISYCDANYVGDKIERRSTSESCHIIIGYLVTWINKKQVSIVISTAKAKFISTTTSCTPLIWIKNQMEDYNIYEESIPIYYENKASISISKNPNLHSGAKHIEIKHHFLRDHVEKGTMELEFVHTDNQFANIFTKPITEERLILLRNQLGMALVKE